MIGCPMGAQNTDRAQASAYPCVRPHVQRLITRVVDAQQRWPAAGVLALLEADDLHEWRHHDDYGSNEIAEWARGENVGMGHLN